MQIQIQGVKMRRLKGLCLTGVVYLVCLPTPSAVGDYVCYQYAPSGEACSDFEPYPGSGCKPGGYCTEEPGGFWRCNSANDGPGYDQYNVGFEAVVCEQVTLEDDPGEPVPNGPFGGNCYWETIHCGTSSECYEPCYSRPMYGYICDVSNSWDDVVNSEVSETLGLERCPKSSSNP